MPQSNGNITKYDQKLARILAAAAQVFADEGYDRAAIRQVAEGAGVSVAGLYYYVRSKEELLYLIQYHAFGELASEFREQSAALAEPEDRLELFIKNHLERFLANLAELIVCSREIDRLKGDFRRRIESRHREYFSLGHQIFKDLAAKHGSASIQPRAAALAMFGSINWVHTWYKPETGPSALTMATDYVQLYLRGVLPEGTPRTPTPT